MAMLFPPTVDSELPQGVLGLLNGTRGNVPQPETALVNGFFGPNIRMHTYEEEFGDFPLPYLSVMWSTIAEVGQISDLVRGKALIMLESRTPREVAKRPEIPLPDAPLLNEIGGSDGLAAGTYIYGLTNFTSDGEGYGGPVASITISEGSTIHVANLAGSGQRLWRTPVDRTYMKYLTVPAATTYDDANGDEYLGGEMFPESALVYKVWGAIRKILNGTLFVPGASPGVQVTSGVLTFRDVSDTVDTKGRNARIKRVMVEYPDIQFNAYDREAQ